MKRENKIKSIVNDLDTFLFMVQTPPSPLSCGPTIFLLAFFLTASFQTPLSICETSLAPTSLPPFLTSLLLLPHPISLILPPLSLLLLFFLSSVFFSYPFLPVFFQLLLLLLLPSAFPTPTSLALVSTAFHIPLNTSSS